MVAPPVANEGPAPKAFGTNIYSRNLVEKLRATAASQSSICSTPFYERSLRVVCGRGCVGLGADGMAPARFTVLQRESLLRRARARAQVRRRRGWIEIQKRNGHFVISWRTAHASRSRAASALLWAMQTETVRVEGIRPRFLPWGQQERAARAKGFRVGRAARNAVIADKLRSAVVVGAK